MIRINLLPRVRKSAGVALSDRTWIALYVVCGTATVAACIVTYFLSSSSLDQFKAKNTALQDRIDKIHQETADLDALRQKLKDSDEVTEIVAELLDARLGPAHILVELSKILSESGRPTIDDDRLQKLREENPLAGFDPTWDGRRLWLTGFAEENRACHIEGTGKTNEDVAEFLRRLAISEYFEAVTLEKSHSHAEAEGAALIDFEVSCKVRY